MPTSRFEAFYRKYVINMQLERTGLFEALLRHYKCTTVLYPGCFIHVTPSFYFPHVVYVDKSDTTRSFFEDMDGVLRCIGSRKHYKRDPFIRFIGEDYTQPLPLVEDSFDLLLSLYAPGISTACKRYVKKEGFVLTNNHRNDAVEAAKDKDLELVAVLNSGEQRYTVTTSELDQYFAPHRRVNSKQPYAMTAEYYLFKRVA